MKLFTPALFFIATSAAAQWSNTTNLFADSLHMQVTSATRNQGAPLIVRSYPDSGYFVIWEDARNDPANTKTGIYAQKYDKTGAALWAANGIPVSASTNNQHYVSQGQDYRNHSYTATDSAGGFYITYADDNVTNYTYQRVCVQHIKSDGTAVFPGPGYIVKSSVDGNFNMSPQLIADGYGGFFISFLQAPFVSGSTSATPDSLFIYCYKDVNGTLQWYGGGQVNGNAIETINSSPCGNYSTVQNVTAEANDYTIFSDLQGGCNVVMYLTGNGAQGTMLGYNKLFRAKSNAIATEHYLDYNYNDSATTVSYQQGNVYRLYYLKMDHQTKSCGSNSNVYVVNQTRLVQNGFQEIDGGSNLNNLADPKGVTVSTSGNINATILAVYEKTYSQSTGVSAPITIAYSVKEEIFDSIPYQRTSNISPNYPGYNTIEPTSLNGLTNFHDTLLAASYNYDFSLTGGSNQVFASTVDGSGQARLQHLAIEQQSAGSFAVVYKANSKQGDIIGKGSYSLVPIIAVNNNGNGLFYIKELDGSTGPVRVSPVLNGSQLAWGAMGKEIGTGVWNGGYYDMITPFVSLDPINGTALIAWTDTRNNGSTGYDIYMRHLDDLNDANYEPPYKRVRSMPNPYGPVSASAVLYGTSNQFTTFDGYGPYGSDAGVSPMADISDNYNLGNVTVSVYENTGSIRSYNGKHYLDRSWRITPDNNPNGAATITIRLFFTTAEFNALQTADPTIKTPGDLAVIKQPGSGSGSTYSIVSGEQTIIPQTWAAVSGGYYIEIQVTSFSNFFIFKNPNGSLPVKWLGIQAQWQNSNHAKVSWQVAEQQDVKEYTVQHSLDGILFNDVCTVTADSFTMQYNCIVPASNGKNYYRVAEVDIDGRKTYSKTVSLQSVSQSMVTVYPNPVKDVLYVSGLQNYFSMQIIDMEGRIVQQQTLLPGAQSINVSGLSKGNYLLKLISNADVQTLKFSKE